MPRTGLRDRVRRVADAGLAAFLPPLEGDPPPAIFIIGAPRSGTTLTYQLMLRAFRLAYINNLTGDFPRGGPVLARWLRCRHWRLPDTFDSRYGRTTGWAGPAEGGRFWYHAIPPGRHHETRPDELSPANIEFMRRFVAAMDRAYRAPFVSKNVFNSVRVPLLDRVFPRSVFVVVWRDPLANAGSMLAGRRRSLGNEPGFWSVRPRRLLDKLDIPVPEHVAWQLLLTYEAIAAARGAVGPHRFLDVRYEELCRRPAATVDAMHRFLADHGIAADRRRLPALGFEPSAGPALGPDDEAAIRRVLRARRAVE